VIQLEHRKSHSATRVGAADPTGVGSDGLGSTTAIRTVSLSVLEAALDYHERGFALLPLRGKEPASDLIRRTHATTSTKVLAGRGVDEEHLRSWFATGGVNVGVFCGAPSQGLVVLDFDDCDFPLPGAHLPPTPTVKTGRGLCRGYHLYYRTRSQVRNEKHPWGEIRVEAPLYVVAPPSVHESGLHYLWERSLDELELADFAQVVLPKRAPVSARLATNSDGKKPIRPTKDFLLGQRPTGDGTPEGWLRSFDRDPKAVEAMARALGIQAPLGRPFRCVLHEEKNASAVLTQATESGEWLYHDFHAPTRGGAEWLSLAQVRAQLSRRGQKLSPSEHATWKLVLLDEAGLVRRRLVQARQLPHGVNATLRHVYERFLYLLGCRWNYEHGEPAPFERKFAAAFCDLPVRSARSAIDELERLQQLVVVGYHGRTRLWLPAGVASSWSAA
jgi:hypothetical protein